MGIHRGIVGQGDGIALVIVLGLLLAIPTNDMADSIDPDIAAGRRRTGTDIIDMPAGIVDLGEGGEQEIAMPGGEIAAWPAESAFIVTGRGCWTLAGRLTTSFSV